MNNFQPKQLEFKKVRGKLSFYKKNKVEFKHNTLYKGVIGLKLMECTTLTSVFLLNLKKIINQKIKKLGNY